MRNLWRVGLVLAALGGALQAQEAETRLLRFPATNGKQIVFSYAGQLYTVAPVGGIARRITTAPGYAIFPRFSPDGKQLAFTAQYDGNTEAYLMPAEGGPVRRLTYTATLGRDDLSDRMGPNNIVMAWENTRPAVVFRSRMRSFNDFIGQLYAAPLDGDLPQQLPVPAGGFVSFSPDDRQMAYNRVFREFRTWKKYRGGMADDIWIFDFKTGHLENITNNPAQDIIPMWGKNNRIYFLSDRDGRLNLFSYDLATKATRQHTHFRDFDIKFPSIGPDAVVFEEAGYLWRFDLASEQVRRVPVTIAEDFAIARGGVRNAAKWITEASPAPDGKRAVLVARGDVFSVAAKHGAPRNLTDTSSAHERGATWSPDGKWIAYLSDAAGENELYVRPAAGPGPAVRVTQGADSYYYDPVWSPDSKKLLWGDRSLRLRYVDVASQAVTTVATSREAEYRQYVWSPDSRWIAYAENFNVEESGIMVYELESKAIHRATSAGYEADSPEFSDDGKYLLFASSRDFHPLYSDTEWNHAYLNMQRVYLLALGAETVSPFAPMVDEVEVAAADGKDREAKPESKAEGSAPGMPSGVLAKERGGVPPLKIDWAGLEDRVVGLPIAPANYGNLRMVGDTVYYQRHFNDPADAGTPGAPDGSQPVEASFSLKDRKETEIGTCENFEVTRDGKHALVQSGHDYGFVDLPVAKLELKDKLDVGGLELHLDRAAEWRQIYFECWRGMRDFFYDPGMHGTDWPGMRDKYAALLPYVKTRYDLTYVIGELIGELQVGHAYVGGGDVPAATRVKLGLLGAELSRDAATRAYRIDHILPGENWVDHTRSPLREIGLGVREGDFILAVDGVPARDLPNIYAALIGKAGRPVTLRVAASGAGEKARDVTVTPTADESPLYYQQWIARNEAYVSAKTHGQVGYLHIPDMGPEGLNEFAKHYYPQLKKKALIVDDRGNGGGNVSPMIIERLRRQASMLQIARDGTPVRDPKQSRMGPVTVLINEYSASDGDLFPYRFRFHQLGKLIGKRTWGGAVGIRDSLPLSDGGQLFRPEFAHFSTDGRQWVVEGHGVDPDIVVDNDPATEFRGTDQQLDRAIEEMLLELKAADQPLPAPPAFPRKS
jgi:tricorn protease